MLRKRLEQYFAIEGVDEPMVIEIPKGNYALTFSERPEPVIAPAHEVAPEAAVTDPEPITAAEPPPDSEPRGRDWRFMMTAGLAAVLACTTGYLAMSRSGSPAPKQSEAHPARKAFWSQVFQTNRITDAVVDDAAVGLFQELSGKPPALSNYYDRSYLRSLAETAAAAKLDSQSASAIVLRRQSSFSAANFLWKLDQMGEMGQSQAVLRFAATIRSGNSRLTTPFCWGIAGPIPGWNHSTPISDFVGVSTRRAAPTIL